MNPSEIPDDFSNNDLIQRLLNDAKRAELEERYGARLFLQSGNPIPPEVEGAFLEHVEELQQRMESAETVTLKQFAGLNFVRLVDDLPTEALEAELADLLNRLLEQGVTIEFPERMAVREAYRLVTEGLLDEPVLDLRLPGLRRHFSFRFKK